MALLRYRVERRARRLTLAPCEVLIPGVCNPETWREFHHRRMFAHGGRHTYANLVVVCDDCHKFIHSNPAWSMRAGLLLDFHPRRYWRRAEALEAFDRLPT